MIKLEPIEIWNEYQQLVQYLANNNVYENVKVNENFYDGKQWEGLEAKNMPTPVFNVLQRCGKFMVASIGSNDIAVQMTPYSNTVDDIKRIEPISKEIENIIEQARIKEASKNVIRNAFVDGAGYMLQTFNPDYETYQEAKGRIENQIIDNTNMYFGNPYSNDIQTQPYIIVALRQYVNQVKKEAKDLGLSQDDIDSIVADNEGTQVNDTSTNLATVLLKFYKKRKKVKTIKRVMDEMQGMEIDVVEEKEIDTVWFTKCTQQVCLIKPTDLDYRRYPISCFGWDLKKNSYLYNSPMTSVIPNQIFINKCFAIAQMYGLQSAFPKIVFDSAKVEVQDFLDNQTFVGPSMDMWGQVLNFVKVPDFSNNIIDLCLQTIQQTKECMGITDASLGQVRPDNTSAIIALQEASSVPLEIQKQNFYTFWEDTIRNLIDIATATYGIRQVLVEDGIATVDFSMLKDLNFNLQVEIGNSAQFSEVAQLNTLDKLVQAGYISPDAYMEAIPSKYIPQKARLIQSYKDLLQTQGAPVARGSNPADEVVPL